MSGRRSNEGKDDVTGQNMWDAAREGNASRNLFASALPGVSKPKTNDFQDSGVSAAFKPINPKAKNADDYEVAMTGPAAFMSPAPKKVSLKKAGATSGLDDLLDADALLGGSTAQAAKPERSKLPVFAAVAASIACVAVIGMQSWPAAIASASGDAKSSGHEISAQQAASAPVLARSAFSADAAITITDGRHLVQPTAPAAQVQPIRSFGTAVPPTQVAMAMPVQPADPRPFENVNVSPKAEFTPLKSGISQPATDVTGLGRTDCAARFDTVSRSGAINFESGSATLLRSSQPILHFFASVFDHCSEFTIAVSGHTDSTGSANLNLDLSQKRAQSVAQFLVGIGVPADSLKVQGYGESKPIASNDTALKRSRNRRIEFTIHDG